ncbi:protein-glutamate O-methyltransferase CheR [Candidatus Dependentiae bacterium]|nr:protein-glutamate O-methyltransferase CheR [Candidatus Dependentiae bacterium]
MKEFIKKICAIITEQTGIDIGFNRYHILNYYIENRLKKLELRNVYDFINLLFDKTNGELDKLIETITVNETFFFRHYEQFLLFKDLLLEQAKAKPFETIKIWSAGCSMGAEPYSIAIIAKEIKDLYGINIKILATDIDKEVLEIAKSGIFSERAVSAEMPGFYKNLYFTPTNCNNYKIKNEIAGSVNFMQHNLWKDVMPDNMDYIFCRNVLFYFRDSKQIKSQLKLYNSLKNGGHLFLSPTESLMDFSEYFIETKSKTGIKSYKKWTTDRRINEKKEELPNFIIEQRRPIENYPLPKIFVGQNNTIFINGIIKNKERINLLAEELYFALGKISSCSPTCNGTVYFSLNFDAVRWLSNDSIKRIKDIISSVKLKNMKLENIICANPKLNEWLNVSGLYSFSIQRSCSVSKKNENFKQVKQPVLKNNDKIEFFLNKSGGQSETEQQSEKHLKKKYQPQRELNENNESNKIAMSYSSQNIKNGQKLRIKYITMEKDCDVEQYKIDLLESLVSNKEIEIDLTELVEINPKFFLVQKRFLNVLNDNHKILFKIGRNQDLLNWIKSSNMESKFYKI